MHNQIRITQETSFIIYGGGEVGNNCCSNLKKQGYIVAAALDKNKSGEHIIEGLYTYKLGTDPNELDKTNCVVVICLANGMLHKTVANELYSLGYPYIVFLPINHNISDEQKRMLTRLYNYVLLADQAMLENDVFSYDKYVDSDMSAECSILCKTSKNVTVWMRLEMLFSESLELWKGDKSKIHMKSQYKDKNIAYGHPCEILFDYFALRLDSCDGYFNSKKKQMCEAEKETELAQREQLYRVFKKEYEKGMDFFIDAAPDVMWNPDNYCNLIGGHHRTMFLLHEGRSLFPVKMQYADLDKWMNEEVYQKLKSFLYEQNIEQFYAPLPHPCFLNFPVQWEDNGRPKLADILRFLANKDVSCMTVLDCGNDEGYYARNMERIGVKEAVFLNSSQQETELAKLFLQLLYRKNVQVWHKELKDMDGGRQFDIVIALGIDNVGAENFSAYVKLLSSLCGQYLIMESTSPDEVSQIQKDTGMKNYICIHKEYKYGKIWKLGVYSK